MTEKTVKPIVKEFDYKSIKTFEDACTKLGITPSDPEIKAEHSEPLKSMTAYYKLVIVFLAINNGWKPDWSDHNEYKYFPWYSVLSSGFGFGDSHYDYADSIADAGSRLCTDSREKALYVANQFEDLYKDYLLYSE